YAVGLRPTTTGTRAEPAAKPDSSACAWAASRSGTRSRTWPRAEARAERADQAAAAAVNRSASEQSARWAHSSVVRPPALLRGIGLAVGHLPLAAIARNGSSVTAGEAQRSADFSPQQLTNLPRC